MADFRAQSWLGCNGVIALFAFAVALVATVIGALFLLAGERDRARDRG